MDRINAILSSQEFVRRIEIINEAEKDRIYCKHDLTHLLDVARIMYIECLEKNLNIKKDVVYAAALLHDIGRSVSNEFHDIESAKIAVHILGLIGFDADEISLIEEAILSHRKGSSSELGDLLYRADKSSRLCFVCYASDTCKWKIKNKGIDR